jgi:hypothetical protein
MHRSQEIDDSALACGLGLTSIAIGLAELTLPQQVENLLGIDDTPQTRGILKVLGVREFSHGVHLLLDGSTTNLASGAWARVAGDALDNVCLAAAATKTKRLGSFSVVAASVMAIGVLDVITAIRLSRPQPQTRLSRLFRN